MTTDTQELVEALERIAALDTNCMPQRQAQNIARETLATHRAQQGTTSEPHGWIVMWPAMGGGHKPIYKPGAAKPNYGPELGPLLTLYPVFRQETPTSEPRLTQEARVGGTVFGVGVPERLVIEAAQRAATEPNGEVSEQARGELQQMLIDNAGRAAFLETHPGVSKELADLIAANEALRLAGLSLIRLAEHTQDCEVTNLDDDGKHMACTCGYDEAIQVLTKARGS